MNLTIESFQSQLEKAFEMGATALDVAIECYLYAQSPGRLKEIRKLQPKYTQEETANEIRRIWKIDPQTYLRISLKLGGGDMDSGRAAMKKFPELDFHLMYCEPGVIFAGEFSEDGEFCCEAGDDYMRIAQELDCVAA